MKNELDVVSFDEVVNTEGKKYSVLRKELVPAYRKVLFDVFKGHVFLLLVLVIDVILIRIDRYRVALPISALLIGYLLAYIHLFVHAAAHYELHANKSINDKISDIFIGVLFGIPVKKYRKIHWMHHEHLGQKNDPEHSYFNELNLLFLLKTITGIHTLSIIISRGKTSEKINPERSFLAHAVYTFIFHAAMLVIVWLAGGWLFLLTWLTGLVIVFPLLATLRQLLEHRDTMAQQNIDYTTTNHGKISRLFGENIFDSSFGAAGFNKHLLHHWDPTISYTRLQEVEDFLKECPETASIIEKSKTSYFKTFIALFKL